LCNEIKKWDIPVFEYAALHQQLYYFPGLCNMIYYRISLIDYLNFTV